jgi:hypothetical protein
MGKERIWKPHIGHPRPHHGHHDPVSHRRLTQTQEVRQMDIEKAAKIIARRITALVASLLLEEEQTACERQGALIAREVLIEAFKAK